MKKSTNVLALTPYFMAQLRLRTGEYSETICMKTENTWSKQLTRIHIHKFYECPDGLIATRLATNRAQ